MTVMNVELQGKCIFLKLISSWHLSVLNVMTKGSEMGNNLKANTRIVFSSSNCLLH